MVRNSGYLSLIQVVNYISPLVILIYLTELLGVELYGVSAYAIAITQISIIVSDLGFYLSATKFISKFRYSRHVISKLIGSIFAIKLIVLVLISLPIVLYAYTSVEYLQHKNIILFTLIPIWFATFIPSWFFSGLEKLGSYAIIIVLSKIIYLGSILFFIRTESDYVFIPILLGLSHAFSLVMTIFLVYKNGYFISYPNRKYIRYSFYSTWYFFISRISVSFYSLSGTIIIGYFNGPNQVAIYSLADQVYKVMQSIITPLNQSLYPYMVRQRNVRLLFKVMICVFVLSLAIIPVSIFITQPLIDAIFGYKWLESVTLINILVFTFSINVLSVFSGYPLSVCLNRVIIANYSVSIGAFVFLLYTSTFVLLDSVTPIIVVIGLLIAEMVVLSIRVAKLWPTALRKLAQ